MKHKRLINHVMAYSKYLGRVQSLRVTREIKQPPKKLHRLPDGYQLLKLSHTVGRQTIVLGPYDPENGEFGILTPKIVYVVDSYLMSEVIQKLTGHCHYVGVDKLYPLHWIMEELGGELDEIPF